MPRPKGNVGFLLQFTGPDQVRPWESMERLSASESTSTLLNKGG